jgi:hypothetical protein
MKVFCEGEQVVPDIPTPEYLIHNDLTRSQLIASIS